MIRRLKAQDKNLRDLLCLVILALIPRIAFIIYKIHIRGALPQAYDTKMYLEQAYAFINEGIIDKDFNGIFYVSYYSFLGVLLKIFRSTDIIVYIQMFINALTVILVYKLGKEIFNRRAAIVSGILYSFLYPLIHWSIFITTDSLFITLMLLQAYFAVLCVKYNRRDSWIKLVILSVYMIFFRPTGIVTLAFTALYLMINADIKGFISRHKKIMISFAVVLAGLLIVIVKIMISLPLTGSLQRNLYWLLTEVYTNGQVYDIKTPYDMKFEAIIPPGNDFTFAALYFKHNFSKILLLYLRRIASFSGVWIWKLNTMSVFKTVTYLLFYGMSFVLLVIGIIDTFRQKLARKGSIVFFMILSIMLFTTFFFMDSAYRYRVPALVFGIFLIAQGAVAAKDYIKAKFSALKVNSFKI
jgi:4-amino-4-deoxy-L-arabinose transferase and related glycosyltransferases of PMT family